MNDNLSEEEKEKLRQENEIRKIKLELEKGAKFFEGPDMPALPPEIENEFLNYIEQFETMNEHSPKISIYDLLGKPDYRNVDDLRDEELMDELDEILDLLLEKGVHVNSVHFVEDREMYRFITEDIFNHEVYMMKKLPGMMTHFTYEEFYPDEVKDVIGHMEDFFGLLFDLSDEENRFQYEVEHRNTTNKWLYEFRNAYYKIDLYHLNIHEVQVDDEKDLTASVVFDISFDAYIDGVNEKHACNGSGNATLKFTPGGWMIQTLSLPKAI